MFAACQKNLYLFTSELSKKNCVIHVRTPSPFIFVHLERHADCPFMWLLSSRHILAILGYQQPFNGTVIHLPTSKSLLIVPLWSYFPLYLQYKFAAIFTSWAGTVYCAYIQTALPLKGKFNVLFILSLKFLAQGLCFILHSLSASFKKLCFICIV